MQRSTIASLMVEEHGMIVLEPLQETAKAPLKVEELEMVFKVLRSVIERD